MTKREHHDPGYDPRIDRRQPPPVFGGCLKYGLLLVGLVVMIGFLAWGISTQLNKSASAVPLPTLASLPTATATPTASPTSPPTLTLDSWSLTGTAMLYLTASPTFTATATLDYCWWLTPTATASPTLAFTPDDWSATGTAVYFATNMPTSPTAQPPRELCTNRPEPSATWTAYPLPSLFDAKSALANPGTLPTSEAPTATKAPVTWTPSPAAVAASGAGAGGSGPAPAPVVITSPPNIVQVTSIVIQQQPVIITATARPATATATITQTPTATITPTMTQTQPPTTTPTVTRDAAWWASATAYYFALTPATATQAPTIELPTDAPTEPNGTESPVLTDVPSATPSETPTPTETASPTPTETATELPTATSTATDAPTDAPQATDESASSD